MIYLSQKNKFTHIEEADEAPLGIPFIQIEVIFATYAKIGKLVILIIIVILPLFTHQAR